MSLSGGVKKTIDNELAKFLLVGVLSTLINYFCFFVFYKFLLNNYVVASGLGYLVGMLAGYVLNSMWSFKKPSKSKKRKSLLLSYFLVYTLSLLLGLLLLEGIVQGLGFSAYIGNLVTIAFTTVSNYVALRYFVFKTGCLKSDFLKIFGSKG